MLFYFSHSFSKLKRVNSTCAVVLLQESLGKALHNRTGQPMAKSNSNQRSMIASEIIQVTAGSNLDVRQRESSQERPLISRDKSQCSKRRKTRAKDSNQMRAGQSSSSSSSTDTGGRVPALKTSKGNSLRQHCNGHSQFSQGSQLDIESNSGSKTRGSSEYQLLFELPVVVASPACSTLTESRDMSFMPNANRTSHKGLKETNIELAANGTKEAKIVVESQHNHHFSQQQAQNRHQQHLKHFRRHQRNKAIQSSTGSREKTARRSRRESSLSLNEVNRKLEDVCASQKIVRAFGNSGQANPRRGSSSKNNATINNKIGGNNPDRKQQQEQIAGKQELELRQRSEQQQCKQQQRKASIVNNASSSIRKVKTETSKTFLNTKSESKVESTIATHLRQSFYSKNLSWQTNLVGRPSATAATATNASETEDSDAANYATVDLFGVFGGKGDEELNSNSSDDRQVEKLTTALATSSKRKHSKGRARSLSSSGRQAAAESNTFALVTSDNTKQVLNCATAAITANFSPELPRENESKAVVSYGSEKMTQATSLGVEGDSLNARVEFGGKASYKRAFFSYPSLSQQSATSAGKTSLSFSDTFDVASGTSKVKLTTKRPPPTRQASSLIHLSIDNLRMIVERNLVATLIGVYILVSLTVIILILPYIINAPREITIGGSAKAKEDESVYERHSHKLSHTSSSKLQTHDYEELVEGFEDKSTQTDPADGAQNSLSASDAIVSAANSPSRTLSSSSTGGLGASNSAPSTSVGNTNLGAQAANVGTVIKSHIAEQKKRVTTSQQQQQRQVDAASSQQAKISENTDSPPRKLINPHLVVGQPSSWPEPQSKVKLISRRNDSTIDDNDHPRPTLAVVVIPQEVSSAIPATTKQDVKRRGTVQLTDSQQKNSTSSLSASSSPAAAAAAAAAVTGFQGGSSHHQVHANQSAKSFGETSQGARVESSKFHDLWDVAHNQQCQPMKISFCSKSLETMFTGFGPSSQSARSSLAQSVSHIAYDKTLLPNQFTHTHQSQIERALQRYDPIIDIKCYALMPLFLCSIYAPKCIQINQTQMEKLHRLDDRVATSPVFPTPTDDIDARGLSSQPFGFNYNRPSIRIQSANVGSQQQHLRYLKLSSWSRLVPPCRSMCREALRKCMFFFEVLSLKLLEPEDCESLPESSDPNICIGQREHKLLQRATESPNCQEDKFRCTDGECIPKKWRCDGFADCTDRSDEDKCSKCNVSTQFYCGQDLCINKEAVCNGIRDCRDGRDERQCLRLSRVAGFASDLPKRFEGQRQLQVWSAVKEIWVPVCGAHWSAMPMSHEACQALGYSRANETSILFGPAQQRIESRFGQQHPRPTAQVKASGRALDSSPLQSTSVAGGTSSDSPAEARKNNISDSSMGGAGAGGWSGSNSSSRVLAAESELSSGRAAVQHEASQHQKQPESRAFGSGGWFDLSSSDPASSYSSADASPSLDEQLVGIVEDMDSSASGVRLSRAGRPDHPIIYERQFSAASTKPAIPNANRQAELIAIDAGESKWKSLTSMLYHGPQTGCLDKPAHLLSTVYLQCEKFQCGRSITSYSTRVRQLRQQRQTSAAATERPPSRRFGLRSALVMENGKKNNLPRMSSAGGQGGGDGDDEGVGLQQQRRQQLDGNPSRTRAQKLEAAEELDPMEEASEDYEQQQQQQPGKASEPTDLFKGEVQYPRGDAFSDSVDTSNVDDYDNVDDDDSDNDDDDDDADDADRHDGGDQNKNYKHQQARGDDGLLLVDKLAREQPKLLESAVSSRFVVGGTESMPGEFPYLAALHGGPDEVFFCGGVLISINWLLTASHCVGNRTQPDGWMVKVGVTRRIASPAFVKKLKVRKIIKHPNFNHESQFNNDIALILLEESVEFNQYLRPICLPRANLKLGPDNSKDCVVVGFGKSKFGQDANYLHVAHFVNVPIVRHSVCSNWYNEHGVNLTEGMLCAGYAEGKRDACQGDSGSGLFCRYSNTNQFFVAGVVSFGIKCATPKLPGVYTSVPTYVDWIESTTRQHGYPLT